MISNYLWSRIFVFGVTGNARVSSLLAMSCAAFTAITWVMESKNDYEAWTNSRRDRERNIPEILLPKTIFDWSEFNRTEAKKDA
ncbi:hypothetical protein Mgra_00003346 [Meloidogyne graminicola]|uniref:Uncharacterized protein n=1 Tax=Meloidogyne graminicola TaxID=189291 RepID=A0A8S9ZUH0_9BILA|nr:hypothetical protein Mgra_00003346 [Meloidogyne graminicola]